MPLPCCVKTCDDPDAKNKLSALDDDDKKADAEHEHGEEGDDEMVNFVWTTISNHSLCNNKNK